jgi:hypothetical protein
VSRRALACLVFLTALFGCASPSTSEGPRVLAEYRPGFPTVLQKTPDYGTYALYQTPAEGETPSSRGELRGLWKLPEREPVGFEKGEDGVLKAVAGDEKVPLA